MRLLPTLTLACLTASSAWAGPCVPDPGPHGPNNDMIWTAGTTAGVNATHWEIRETVRLTGIEMWLTRNPSTTLTFTVWESPEDDNTFDLIASTSGTSWEWHQRV